MDISSAMGLSYKEAFLGVTTFSVVVLVYYHLSDKHLLESTSDKLQRNHGHRQSQLNTRKRIGTSVVSHIASARNTSVPSYKVDVNTCSLKLDPSSIQTNVALRKLCTSGYVYSSYYDDRSKDTVKIVALGYGQCPQL